MPITSFFVSKGDEERSATKLLIRSYMPSDESKGDEERSATDKYFGMSFPPDSRSKGDEERSATTCPRPQRLGIWRSKGDEERSATCCDDCPSMKDDESKGDEERSATGWLPLRLGAEGRDGSKGDEERSATLSCSSPLPTAVGQKAMKSGVRHEEFQQIHSVFCCQNAMRSGVRRMYRGRLASGRLPTELPSGATGERGRLAERLPRPLTFRPWSWGGCVEGRRCGAWCVVLCGVRCAAWRGFRLVGCGVAFGLHGAFRGWESRSDEA